MKFRPYPMMLAALLAMLLAAILPGCQNKISDKNLVLIEPIEAEALIQPKRELFGLGGTSTGVWVDPRGQDDYRKGHISGAVNIPYEKIRTEHARLDGYKIIIVYGDDYNSPVALAMSKTLMELGYKDVRTLHGGLHAWKNAGNPIEEGEPKD